ncbi:DUF3253 domain-containing protein [Plantibacter flavus]|uniref:DUF3253 domain-containing protein n=1 Tax=Plantibacter flavus TaxID=150123 RepID=UPI0010C1AF42|nr:DUF3253 domain-containing protein [Plantibacter flavus]TKJ95513.1 DUF3253 domain-containing protein [Plantibacter flavus]
MTDGAESQPKRAGVVDDDVLERTILDLLGKRAATSSICPSDVARAVGGDDWRALMDDTRRVAWRLVDEGRVRITQGDEAVDRATVRGPIRIRWVKDAVDEQ